MDIIDNARAQSQRQLIGARGFAYPFKEKTKERVRSLLFKRTCFVSQSHKAPEALFFGLADGAKLGGLVPGAEVSAYFTAPDRDGKLVFINLDGGFFCHFFPHIRRRSSLGYGADTFLSTGNSLGNI